MAAGSAAEALGLFSIVLAVLVALGETGEELIVAVATVLQAGWDGRWRSRSPQSAGYCMRLQELSFTFVADRGSLDWSKTGGGGGPALAEPALRNSAPPECSVSSGAQSSRSKYHVRKFNGSSTSATIVQQVQYSRSEAGKNLGIGNSQRTRLLHLVVSFSTKNFKDAVKMDRSAYRTLISSLESISLYHENLTTKVNL